MIFGGLGMRAARVVGWVLQPEYDNAKILSTVNILPRNFNPAMSRIVQVIY